MTSISTLTTAQLKSIIAVKEQIEALQSQLDSLVDGSGVPTASPVETAAPTKRKYHMTAAHKRKLIKALAKARKIRLANLKGPRTNSQPVKKKDRRSSPAVRAKLAAAAKARWARVRAQGKNTL